MEADRLQRALELFEQALTMRRAEVDEWIESRTGADIELRSYVLNLLAVDERAQAAIRTAAGNTGVLGAAGEWIGRTIGPYRIKELLGEGGMSVVFLAERTDGTYEDTVALKLIKDAAATDDSRRRFELERQVLANLRHPNIATLLDGGREDDVDYVVLEHIEGELFVDYQKDLTIEATLRLFRDVCSAVEYAHQSLIVHRDIKPANVLVDRQGVVKLLDFGIAKDLSLQDQGATVWTMTPAYASPEQVSGQPITVATDVYSLGVVLYESLVGERPHDIADLAPAEAVTVLLQSAPDLPSRGSQRMRELSRYMRDDLDAIVMRALSKDPARRYPSVTSLIADLDAFFEGRPVAARIDTAWYRVGKFVRRHKAVAAASLIAIGSVSIGLVVALSQVRIANEQLARSEAVSRYLQDILTSPDPTWNIGIRGGPDVTVAETLESAEAQLDNDLLDQPLVRIELYDAIGAAQMWLDNRDAALSARRKALALRREAFAGDALHESEGLMRLAEVHDDWDESATSIPMYFEAVAAFERAGSPATKYGLLLLNDTSVALMNVGRYEEAVEYQRRAKALAEAGAVAEGDVDDGILRINLGRALLEAGAVEEAEAMLQLAHTRFAHSTLVPHYYKARLLRSLGLAALIRKQYVQAASWFADAVSALRDDPSRHVLTETDTLDNLGWQTYAELMARGTLEEEARERLAVLSDEVGTLPNDTDVWIYYFVRGVAQELDGRKAAAQNAFEAAERLAAARERRISASERQLLARHTATADD